MSFAVDRAIFVQWGHKNEWLFVEDSNQRSSCLICEWLVPHFLLFINNRSNWQRVSGMKYVDAYYDDWPSTISGLLNDVNFWVFAVVAWAKARTTFKTIINIALMIHMLYYAISLWTFLLHLTVSRYFLKCYSHAHFDKLSKKYPLWRSAICDVSNSDVQMTLLFSFTYLVILSTPFIVLVFSNGDCTALLLFWRQWQSSLPVNTIFRHFHAFCLDCSVEIHYGDVISPS